MPTNISRRRFLSISAAAAGLAVAVPLTALARTPVHRWRGVALGASAEILITHPDKADAERIVEQSIAEIRRLENVFSLYRQTSAVSQLNRMGYLDAPPLDLLRLCHEAALYHDWTGGAFDITVQPLWDLYARHTKADTSGPSADTLANTLALVDQSAVMLGSQRIVLAKPGMAVTFNGIAQGYITDRVADIMRENGLDNVLLNLGESRALGGHPDGRAWRAGVSDPSGKGRIADTVTLRDMALATSNGRGTPLGPNGRLTHLFDPHNGSAVPRHRQVSVVAHRASTADALSTAFSFMPVKAIPNCLHQAHAVSAHIYRTDDDAPLILYPVGAGEA